MPSADVTIDRAIGVLMWWHDLDDHQAFRWLVNTSQAEASTVLEAAEHVLEQIRPRAS